MAETSGGRARARPVAAWARGYPRAWLRPDLVAALTVWAVLVPESLAYATIAGVSPVVGLYAAVPALLVYALLGTSRYLVVGPMSATAALSATIAASYSSGSPEDFLRISVTLSVAVGLGGVLAGLARLGFLASFISEPVLKGFIVGLALTIVLGQVPSLLGLEKPEGGFFLSVVRLAAQLGEVQVPTMAVGVLALLVLGVLKRFVPLVPAAFVAVLGGIGAVALLGLEARGVEVVGAIEPGLPVPGLPGSSPQDYLTLLGPAAGVLLIAFVEGLAAAKAYAGRDGDELDVDRELIALGGANLGSGLLGGMVVNGSLSKTAVNGAAGARSQLSSVVVAGLTVLTLLLLTGLFEQLPEAVLAAVVIAAVVELVDLRSIRRFYDVWTSPLGRIHRHAARADFIAALAALLGVLVLDTLPGLLLGVLCSLALLLYRSSRPHVARLVRSAGPEGDWVDHERHPHLAVDQDVVVLRVEGGLFFANAEHVRARVRDELRDPTVAVVLDLSSVASIDVSAAAMLQHLDEELATRATTLHVAGTLAQVRDVVRTSGHGAALAHLHPDVDTAVDAALAGRAGQGDARDETP